MTSPPSIQELSETINQLLQNQQSFQASFSANLNNLTNEFHDLRTRLPPPGFPPPFTPPITDTPPPPATTMKLDIPRFNGTDVVGWIFKINQFFDYHHTPEDQRLRIASFYMEAEALGWFQWMHANGQLLNWALFLQSLESRFAPSLYEDPKGALFKLCQVGSVREYQSQFESLANRIVIDMFVLPLSGAELVLGVQWLKTLGPIVTDYEQLTMSFAKNGETVQLAGVPKPMPEEANLH
jgi:hypothetical protein